MKSSLKLLSVLLFIAAMSMLLSGLFAIPFAVPFVGLLAASLIASPKGALLDTLAPDLMKALEEMKQGFETKMKTEATGIVTEQLEVVNQAIKELKEAKPDVTADEIKSIKDQIDANLKFINVVAARVKSGGGSQQPEREKSFNEVLAETIEDNIGEIKSFRQGQGEKRFEMKGYAQKDEKGKLMEVKAVGDMSIAANFSTANTFYQDVRNQLIETPFNRVWLADLLPQGTSGGTSILYPKENGLGEGGAAVWTDKTADKAQMDFDLTGQSAYFKWIAGYVIVEREMLDDIPFMTSYIQQKMLISFKKGENAFILDGTTDTNPVQGFNDVATAYNGTYTNKVDRIIDAAWGQLVEDTFDYYNPTNIILTPRDSVGIGLNKATGSGEYDLPAGSVAFANGQLQVGGIPTAKTTQVGTGNFMVFDKNAFSYVRRMMPELRMFEDAALAKRNKIMFRIEGRSTLACFNNAAIIKGTLAPAS